jgi:hypothetical protein
MKKWLAPVLALGLLGALQDPVILGIAQLQVRMYVGGTVKLRTTSLGGIAPTFTMRNTQVARVDSAGVVKGLRAGVTWVRAKYYDGQCIKTDSAKVVVLRKPSAAGFMTLPVGFNLFSLFSPRPKYTTNADRVMASAVFLQSVAGITPRSGAQAAIGTTYSYTVSSVAPISATVVSRNTAVATVTNGGVATGVGEGDTWIVATVFNGHCSVKDSARITVIDTTALGEVEGDSARGRVAWLNSCQECHTHDRPIDMELFNFTSVIRRAMNHVDTLTALDIVADIARLGAGGPLTPTTVIYQPGSPATAVASDTAFAVALWGADEWRSSLTRDSLLAVHIKDVRIPITLPLWSDESSAYDWIPGTGPFTGQIPAGVLNSALVQNAYATYRANPTVQNAGNLAGKLSNSAHNEAIPDAPCVYNASNWQTRFDSTNAQKCADVLKWGANLMYQTGVASGLHPDTIIKRSEGVWWETGHMFHKAQQRGRNIELRSLQTCAWIYLGSLWTGAARREASLYMTGPCGGGSTGLNYKRWASWMTMYMAVRRSNDTKGSTEICRDVWSMADHGHSGWFATSIAFGFREIMYRLDNGFQLAGAKTECTANSTSTTGSIGNAGYLGQAMTLVNNKAGAAVFNALKPLADSVRARINAL